MLAGVLFLAKIGKIWYNSGVMKNRTHFYVSIKDVMTWLIALCMVGSAVARILFVNGEGVDTWSQIVLPVAAAVLFVCILLASGKERFYKTAIPVWMYCAYFAILFWNFRFSVMDEMIGILYGVLMLTVAVMYTRISSGKTPATSLLLPLMAVPCVAWLYLHWGEVKTLEWKVLQLYSADILMTLGLMLLPFAVRIHPAGEYHPTWGDRLDGRRLRTLDAMSQVSPYIMTTRNSSDNTFSDSFEITNLERFIRAQRRDTMPNLGLMHILLAAYCRGVAKYPGLNRFVSGQKVYTHGDDIQFCMTIKKEMTTDSPETVIKLHLTPRDTLQDVYDKFNAAVEEVKNTPLDSSFDNLVRLFTLIPGVFLRLTVDLLKFMDYFGLLPGFLLELSPFHGSVFFTSMGSLGIPPIYHHLYDFGNLPVFGSFGCKRRALEVLEDGAVVQRKYLDCKFTLDERTVDGFYYAAFLKYYKRLIAHPEVLLAPPEKVVQDID